MQVSTRYETRRPMRAQRPPPVAVCSRGPPGREHLHFGASVAGGSQRTCRHGPRVAGLGGRGLREGVGALQPGGFPSSSWRLLPAPIQKGAQPVRSGCHWGRHVLFLTLPTRRAGVWQLIAAPRGSGSRKRRARVERGPRPPPSLVPVCAHRRGGEVSAGPGPECANSPPGLRQGARARGGVWDPTGQHVHTWVCVPRRAWSPAHAPGPVSLSCLSTPDPVLRTQETTEDGGYVATRGRGRGQLAD